MCSLFNLFHPKEDRSGRIRDAQAHRWFGFWPTCPPFWRGAANGWLRKWVCVRLRSWRGGFLVDLTLWWEGSSRIVKWPHTTPMVQHIATYSVTSSRCMLKRNLVVCLDTHCEKEKWWRKITLNPIFSDMRDFFKIVGIFWGACRTVSPRVTVLITRIFPCRAVSGHVPKITLSHL